MTKPEFVYVTYIVASPDTVWDAITDPDKSVAYWAHRNTSDWQVGSRWDHLRGGDPDVSDIAGKVMESERPHRLVTSWARPADVDDAAKHSRVTYELMAMGDATRLTVIHEGFGGDDAMRESVSKGWPAVLSSLKSWIETGKPLALIAEWTKEGGQPKG